MGIFMKKIILIYGLLASSFSFGADWGEIGESDNKKYYYDIDSVKSTGGYKYEFWQKQVSKANTQLVRVRVDCIKDNYTILDVYIYQGEKVTDSLVNQEHTLTPPPGTAGYQTIERVCNYGVALEIEKLNLPKKQDYTNDADFEVAKFMAFGFSRYAPTEEMMNDYYAVLDDMNKESKIYKKFIKVLDGISNLKLKYVNLKIS